MKDNSKNQWRQAVRKLKALRKRLVRLENKIDKTPRNHNHIARELYAERMELRMVISTLELKAERLRP